MAKGLAMMKPRASCCLQTLMWPNCVPKASLKELQMRCFRWHFVTLAMHCLLTAQLSSPTCRQELLLDDSSSSKLNPQRMWRTHPVRIQFGNYRTSGQKDKQRVALRDVYTVHHVHLNHCICKRLDTCFGISK